MGALDVPPTERSLRRTDYLLLFACCLAWWGIALFDGRTLTTHETTHCQNVREMFEDGQFLYATYGRRPWLERPSLPHLMTGIPAEIVADCRTPWAMRFGSFLAGLLTVFVLSGAIAGAVGRNIGLVSGLALATMREFAAYAIGTEADIFLAMTVTIAGSLFIRAEFGPNGGRPEQGTLFGLRPIPLLLMYAVLGLTNAMKGPLFGTVFIGSAMAGYCFLGRNWSALRRWVTVWGWLIYFALGAIWPVISLTQFDDAADIWLNDYGKRWGANYVGEPRWYYLVHVPWNLFPWTIPAFVGLAVTAKAVFKEQNRFWQFIWAWAILPPIVLSVFQGKHHHYMLNCIAPWAPLSVVGGLAMWRWVQRLTAWRRNVWLNGLVFGVPIAVAVVIFNRKIPGPSWVAWVLAVGWILTVLAFTYYLTRPRIQTSLIGLLVIGMIVQNAAYLHRTKYLDSYEKDLVFIREIPNLIPPEAPLYVINEYHVLNVSWVLYYEPHPTQLLHNMTYLASERITSPTIYVIARRYDEPTLKQYGTVQVKLVSEKTRAESSPMDRYTLYELTFRPNLERYPEPPMRILEALGRIPGPELPKP